ncbi:MAG: hypothetical protein CUR34_00870 [Sediminibacterium sp.]|nr:MAG: hypothetical protein CUR34_00870 [Sediminibacterium sp.] [Sediminibacterium sp. FEMGT703S]
MAQMILMIVSIISGMVFSRSLSVAHYGTYMQTFIAYDFAVPILTLGLPSALYYFLPNSSHRQKGVILDNIFLLLVAGVIFSLFLALGGAELLARRFKNPELTTTLKWMIYYPLYTFPVLISSAVWVVKDKVKLNAIFNVVTGIILTILLILAASISKDFLAPALTKILLPLLFLPITLYYIFKYIPGDWDLPRISSMWEMVKFSIPLGLSSVIGTITTQLSGMIVALQTSPEDFAIYVNGAREVPLIGIVTGSISIVIMSEMAQKIKNGDLQAALALFRKSAVVSACFLIPIMIFLLIQAENFITILYSNKYESSVIPFRIYLLAIPIRIVYYSAAFIALGKSKKILFRSAIDLCLTAIFCYILVSLFGYNGAPLGLILTMFLWTVPYNLYALGKDFNCSAFYIIPFRKVGKIFLISLFSGLFCLPFQFIKEQTVFLFVLGFLVFVIIYFILAYRGISEFKETVTPYFKKINQLKANFF